MGNNYLVQKDGFHNKVRLIATIVFAGMCFGIFRAYLSSGTYPFNTFLFNPNDRYNDLFNMIKICSSNNPYFNKVPFSSNYFPIANTFFYLFSLLGSKKIIIITFFGLFIFIYSLLIKYFFPLNGKKYLLEYVIIFFVSYPMLFNFDRMNLEIYNFVFCLLWIYFKEKKMPFWAIFFLSISISMKLYTGVFAIIYLLDKHYRQLIILAVLVAVISLTSIATFPGGAVINAKEMYVAMKAFTENYLNHGPDGLHFGISFFGVIKILFAGFSTYIFGKDEHLALQQANKYLTFYSMATILSFLGIIFLLFKKKLFKWEQYFLVIVPLLVFPHISFDYKLIFVFLPLIFFLKEKGKSRNDIVFTVLFALLLIPHNYYFIISDISIAVFIYPAIILLMSLLIIFKNHPKTVNGHT